MSKSDNPRRAGSPATAQTPVPTPSKSTVSRRSSPRSTQQVAKAASPHLRSPCSPAKADPAASKKRKSSVKQWSPVSEDVLCPICDDVCTCSAELSRDNGQGSASGSASGWSSPIIIKDRKSTSTSTSGSRVRNAVPAKPKASLAATKKSPQSTKNKRKERRIDMKADAMAQLVLSEYYFSAPVSHSEDEDEDGQSGDEYVLMEMDQSASESYSYSDTNSSSDLDEIIFELSESEDEETTRRMKELLMSKVNSVIGPNAVAWAGDSDQDSDGSEDSRDYDEPRLYMFDPTDAANLVVHLPLPSASQTDEDSDDDGKSNLANLTPQVLAAISAASKTLTAATQHYTHNPTVPYSRDQGKQVAFVIEPETSSSSSTASASLRFDDLIDMSRLHGSSPPTPAAPMSQFMSKRWDRIPISSFRKRRLSVPRNVLPPNAIKQPPPELPNERFAQLHISEQPSPTDLLIILESEDHTSSGQRERRSTIQVTPGQAVESLEEDPGYYWPLAGDEDLHWLGEHFRTNLA